MSYPASTSELYSRAASPNRFSAPIDKIFIRVPGQIDLSRFVSFMDEDLTRKLKFKKPFFSGEGRGYATLVLEEKVKITIFTSTHLSEIQINPTQFDSFTGMCDLLREITGYETQDMSITKIHFFVDVRGEMNRLLRGTYRKKSSKSKTFVAPAVVKEEGRTHSLTQTKTFGAREAELCIYDATTKHGYYEPTVRVEQRFNTKRSCPIKKISDLEFIDHGELNPFEKVSLIESIDCSELKDLTVKELIERTLDTQGVEGLKEIRRKIPKLSRDIQRVLETGTFNGLYPIERIFADHLENFLTEEASSFDDRLNSSISMGLAYIDQDAQFSEGVSSFRDLEPTNEIGDELGWFDVEPEVQFFQ